MIENKVNSILDIPNISDYASQEVIFECYDKKDNIKCYWFLDKGCKYPLEIDIVLISDTDFIDKTIELGQLLTQKNLRYFKWTYSTSDNHVPTQTYIWTKQ